MVNTNSVFRQDWFQVELNGNANGMFFPGSSGDLGWTRESPRGFVTVWLEAVMTMVGSNNCKVIPRYSVGL